MYSSVQSILLILVAGIGDFVMATNAIRAVRKGYPDAELHVLTSSEGATIAQGQPGVDRVWAFPIRELRSNRLRFGSVIRLIRRLRGTRYDIVANLYPVGSWSGSVRMGLLFSCLKARNKIGQAYGPVRFCLDQRLPPNEFVGKHMVDAMAEVAVAIGGKLDGGGLELPCPAGCSGEWGAFFAPAGGFPPRPVIGLNPGGDRPNRRWSPEKFAAAARALASRCGASILIFGGPGEEQLGQKIKDALDGAVLNVAGRLSLPDLAALLSRCDLLITNDSGPMHMAVALRTPVVALFGPENAGYFRPYTSSNLCRVIQKQVACRPCSQTDCRTGLCLDMISPAEVVEKSLELLNETRSPIGDLHPEDPGMASACYGVLPEPEDHVRHLR